MRLVFSLSTCITIITALLACNHVNGEKSKDSADTLAFTYKTAKSIQVNDSNKDSSLLFRSSITYPVFENNSNKALVDSIDRYLQYAIFGGYPTANEATQNFINESIEQTEGETGASMQGWVNLDSVTIITNSPVVACLKSNHYSFTGGAHGNPSVTYVNFESPAGNRLSFESIASDNASIEKLEEINIQQFRKSKNIAANTTIEGAGYFVNGNKLPLPSSFAITKDGLLMSYNYYEVACYADGVTEYLIPFDDLKGIIKDKFIIK